MADYPRREFIKQCGAGLGLVAAGGLFLGNIPAFGQVKSGKEKQMDLFGITTEEMKTILQAGLSKGGEFSELFFEYTVSKSVTMEEEIIKSSSNNIQRGVGVRVIRGDQTGYAYTNELTFESINKVALTAAAIAGAVGKIPAMDLRNAKPTIQTYDMKKQLIDVALEDKIKLVKEAYSAAKNYDSKITKIRVTLSDELQQITIANSEGLLISDVRPQARLVVSATAESNGKRATGNGNAGGRIGWNFYKNNITPTDIGKKAAEEAVILLEADSAPAGEYAVVLSKDQSGVMIHEAVGHPLEADANRKKQSIMWDKLNTMVANPIVTIYDDATIPEYRGSLNIDDEGTAVENTMLIEKGKLVGYLNDRLAAKVMNHKPNGHGRRENYTFNPIPRMTNTILGKGEHDPEEIIKSVDKGFYAVTYQGGQVSDTGKFTFSVNLGYMIENGILTRPVRNATLIGTNVQILKEVSMIGNDTGFFLGTCGKEGQSIPVTAGTPTLKINKMTVGGKA